MTPTPSGDRPRPTNPGTAPIPRVSAPVADPSDTIGWQPASEPTPPPPAARMPTALVEESSMVEDDVPAVDPEPAPGRAGRNLGAAIGVGLSLGAVIIASLVIWRPAFLAVLAVAVVVGVIELARALGAGRFRVPVVPLLVGSLAMVALAWT